MIVYGKNAARETLKNDVSIKKIYMTKEFKDDEILKMIKDKNIHIEYKERKDMDKVGVHQGIILEVEEFKYCDLDDLLVPNPFIVILDHIEDVHNFGAIIRTCEACGVTGIIIPKDRSVSVNSTVMRTSAGAANNMKICMVTNLNRTIDILKNNGVWIVGSDMDGTNYCELDLNTNVALVIGSEGFGMSRLVKEKCDFIATIPMKGKVNSLNASVAAGILIYKIDEMRMK